LGGVISSGYVKWIDVDTDTLLAGNSDVKITSQKAIKKYVDNAVASGVSDGDKGDIDITGGGTVYTIDSTSVTFLKMQNIGANSVIGRYTSGAGIPQSLILGNMFSFVADTIKVSYTNLLNKPTLGSLAALSTADTSHTTAKVISVNGYKGIVSLSKSDLSLGNVENTALSTWAGSSNITTLGTISTGSIPESKLTFTDITTGDVSTSYHGFVPKAPNDTTKFLSGGGTYDYIHDADTRTTHVMELKLILDATSAATTDSIIVCVPTKFNGMNLVNADAFVTAVSSSGTPTFTITNVTDATNMLSTNITIDASEYSSYTAATAPVIDTSYDDVAAGDLIKIKCTTAGTGTKGSGVILVFQKP